MKIQSELDDERKVQIYFDGEWFDVHLLSVLRGDLFRMFEPDGTPVRFSNNCITGIARQDAYANDMGNIVIENYE